MAEHVRAADRGTGFAERPFGPETNGALYAMLREPSPARQMELLAWPTWSRSLEA